MASILLVHDSEIVGSTTRMMLQRAGHDVRAAPTGLLGLRRFIDHGADMVIARAGIQATVGVGLGESVRQVDPHVPILLTCAPPGPTDSERQDADRIGAGILPAPFTRHSMEREIHQRLSGSRT